jgi:hypothetical protein
MLHYLSYLAVFRHLPVFHADSNYGHCRRQLSTLHDLVISARQRDCTFGSFSADRIRRTSSYHGFLLRANVFRTEK